MSRIDAELQRIRELLQKNYPSSIEEQVHDIKRDFERGDAFYIFANLLTPEEEGPHVDEKTAEENRKKERIFLQIKTLDLPQDRKVKVIFQTIEDRENDELLHLLHKRTR